MMPYTSFHYHFREIAEKETRTLTRLHEDHAVLRGNYGLLEMYCDDPDCDCQRVFFEVYDWERQKSMAYIAYGWESTEFYRRWLRMDNPVVIREMQGPILNDESPQSKYAPAFLKLVKDVVLSDPAYSSRLKRHYQTFKEKVDPMHFPASGAAKRVDSVHRTPAKNMRDCRATPVKPKSRKRRRNCSLLTVHYPPITVH